MGSRFTSELWKGIGDIYSAILVHPFLTGLTDGSLRSWTILSEVVSTRSVTRPGALPRR